MDEKLAGKANGDTQGNALNALQFGRKSPSQYLENTPQMQRYAVYGGLTGDCNNYISDGTFVCPSYTAAKNILNLPVAEPGTLYVYSSTAHVATGADWTYLIQKFVTITAKEYTRQIYKDGTWRYMSWREYAQVESGTWTPRLIGGTVSGAATSSDWQAYYCRAGNLVNISFYLLTRSLGGAEGILKIAGLPYPTKADSGVTSGTIAAIIGGFNLPSGTDVSNCFSINGSEITLKKITRGQSSNLLHTDVTSIDLWGCTATYII